MTDGVGGILSIRFQCGAAADRAEAARVQRRDSLASLGGVESLIEHRASIEGPQSPVPDDLLRLSVGLEAAEDLINDLKQALAQLSCVSGNP